MPTRSQPLIATLRYLLDRQLAKGTLRHLLWIVLVSLGFLTAAALVLASEIRPESGGPDGFFEALFYAVNLAMDPGEITTGRWAYRLTMLCVSLFGVLVISTVIGVMTSGIEERLQELRRGRSTVLENEHTVILGWSQKVVGAIAELVIANESRPRGVIVILADRDKLELEEHVRGYIPHLSTTEVICRRGDPCDLADLPMVSPEAARSFLLFANDREGDDKLVFKSAMALQRVLSHGGCKAPIIAEVRDSETAAVLRHVPNVLPVQPLDLVMRILVQAARQPGLSAVYEELLSFAGCEIYFTHAGQACGRSFGEVVMSYTHALVIGIKEPGGAVRLNPPHEEVVQPESSLVVIARDDSEIGQMGDILDLEASVASNPSESRSCGDARSYLIIGWHSKATLMLRELDQYLAAGSRVTLIYDPRYTGGPPPGLASELKNLELMAREGATLERETLESVDMSAIDEIVILSYRDALALQAADSQTLLSLVHLRALVAESGVSIGFAAELLDARNRALADCSYRDDFIASEELASSLMAQLSESPELAEVFRELLTADGSELYLREAPSFSPLHEPVAFGSLVLCGLARREIPIGLLERGDAATPRRLTLAPDKRRRFSLKDGDFVVTLALD